MLKTHSIKGHSLDNEMRFFLSYVPSLALIVSKGFTSISMDKHALHPFIDLFKYKCKRNYFIIEDVKRFFVPLFYYGNLFKILSKEKEANLYSLINVFKIIIHEQDILV